MFQSPCPTSHSWSSATTRFLVRCLWRHNLILSYIVNFNNAYYRYLDLNCFVCVCLQLCLQTSLSWRTWRFWTCSITRLRSFPLRSAAFRSWSTSTLGDFPFSNVVYRLKMLGLWVLSRRIFQISFNFLFLIFSSLSMNRLSTLPRGFGSLPALEVLDLTYNNLNQSSLPGNFFYLSEWKHVYVETSAGTSPAGCWCDLNNEVFCFCSNSSCSLSQRQWLWNHPCWHWEAVKAANCEFISMTPVVQQDVGNFVFVKTDLCPFLSLLSS